MKYIPIFVIAMSLLGGTPFAHASHNDDEYAAFLETTVGATSTQTRTWSDLWRRSSSIIRTATQNLGSEIVTTIPIPVLFGASLGDISENFGDIRGGGTRLHEGLDIIVARGTPVISPTKAVVTRIGEGASAGKYVRTANPGGETFVYMHLDAVRSNLAEGDIVEAGEVIGYVGDTGNAIGGAPHLHFEIRNGGAQDPFPRITHELTVHEKVESVSNLLEIAAAPQERARELVQLYPDFFSVARAADVPLPDVLLNALDSTNSSTAPAVGSTVSTQELAIGDTGSDVVLLQQLIITNSSGPAHARLARAGATGYFGPITQAALTEYRSMNSVEHSVFDAPSITQAITAPVFTRDLTIGSRGTEVYELQVFLNKNGFALATTGAGSPGSETSYFGSLTQQALARYQASNGIVPAVGYFGPITRAHIASAPIVQR